MSLSTKLAALAVGTILAASGAAAQTYPDRSITMVVPFAAGGPTDKVARDFAEALRKSLNNQTNVIENAGGDGGTSPVRNRAGIGRRRSN